MRKSIFIFHVLVLFVVLECSASAAPVPLEPIVPVKDTVTMVDLGAKTCIPCKMMAPILEELKKEYDGRAAVIFIDVWEDKSQGKRFGIQSIPTQIFYDKLGSEVYRHQGFYSKKDIKKWLDTLIEK
jgi:thioredoxin 1